MVKLNNIPFRNLNLCSSLLLSLIAIIIFLSLSHYGSIVGFAGIFLLCYGFTQELELSIWGAVISGLIISWIFYPPVERFTDKIVKNVEPRDKIPKGENLLDSIMDDGEFDESQDQHQIDQSATLQKVFDGLDSKTLEGLTNDTKYLMKMQKDLFKTLKTVEPMLSKGAGLIEQFRRFIPKN